LDDIFIVSEKCAERVLSTLNVDAGSHVLEFLFSNLRGTFKDILLQRLKEALDSERIIRMGTSQQYTHLHISRLLNTFSASTTFITTLYESVLKRLQRLFKSNPDDDKERIYRLVTRHGSLTVEDFQKAFHVSFFLYNHTHSSTFERETKSKRSVGIIIDVVFFCV
jgi:hypothetical protein